MKSILFSNHGVIITSPHNHDPRFIFSGILTRENDDVVPFEAQAQQTASGWHISIFSNYCHKGGAIIDRQDIRSSLNEALERLA